MPSRRAPAFTLIELMVTVAIISVLALIALKSFSVLRKRAYAAEVSGMLGEFALKEEAYRTVNGSYLSTGTSENDIRPQLTAGSEPVKKDIAIATDSNLSTWKQLNIRPPSSQLWCGYVVMAFASGATVSSVGTGEGANQVTASYPSLGGTGTLPEPWFYGRACCDLGGTATTSATCETSSGSVKDCTGKTQSTFTITATNNVVGSGCEDE